MQLGLQALILRDNGYACEEGIIFYRGTRQRIRLLISPELEEWVVANIEKAGKVARGPIPPPLVDSPKCPRCSLVNICMPDETRLLATAPDPPEDEDEEAAENQIVFAYDYDFPAQKHTRRNRALPLTDHGRPALAPPSRRLIATRDDKRPLYLNTYGLFVRRRGDVLEMREDKQTVAKVRINDLHHVAIFGPVQVSTPVIQTLCQKDIPITYFSTDGWFYGITRGHSLKNVFTRIEQFQQANESDLCLFYAKSLVYGKIRNQRTMLMRNHVEPPRLALQKLKFAARTALEADSIETLMGIEGAAALTYFQHFSGMIKYRADPAENIDSEKAESDNWMASFDFNGRNRRPPKDAVNALLSLGYSLLARDCTIAAYTVGFDPYVGFFHRPRFGRPALALDIMEEFRPIIADSVALNLINNGVLSPSEFVRAGDAVNLSAAGRKTFFQFYEKRLSTTINHPVFDYKVTYRRAIELQFRLLAKALTGEIEAYSPFMTR